MKPTNQRLNCTFGKMKYKKSRQKPKLIFFYVSVAVFYYFAANPQKAELRHDFCWRKAKHSIEIKLNKI